MRISKLTALKYLFTFICGVGFTLLGVYYKEVRTGYFWSSIITIRDMSRKSYGLEQMVYIERKEDYTGNIRSNSSVYYNDRTDNTTAEQLYKKVRVLCWIMTSPSTLKTRATHVRDTWSKRCNIRLFMSSVEDKEFPAIGLQVNEGRMQLYEKTKAAFRYIWEHYKDEADWFLKADDDTYVIVENLRYLLKDFPPNKPIYFGKKFKTILSQGWMTGGPGYVLSKEALTRYIKGLDTGRCPKGKGYEDVDMGRCLSLVHVDAGDSRDSEQRERFHNFGPEVHLIPDSLSASSWYWKLNYYPTCLGMECSSNYPISFHYMSGEQMHILEYTIYKVQVYGVSHIYNRYEKLP